jgi:hypothetical protein
MGIREMMLARQLTSVQMQQLRVMKAFEKHPKFNLMTKSIVNVMLTVRND